MKTKDKVCSTHLLTSTNQSIFTSCIVCDSSDHKLLFKNIKDLEYETYKPVDYKVCKNCELISQEPLPKADFIETFYPQEYRNYLLPAKNLLSFLKKAQFLSLASKIGEYFSRDSKVLEIGFGNGQLLLALKQKGYTELYGSDFIDKTFLNLKDTGIKLTVSNIEETFPFSETFDVIIMNNVIEHFLDPVKVLKNCLNNLAKNGKVILITPNSNALELLVFKKFWAGFHSPRHTFIFNEKNIEMLSNKLGFSKARIISMTDPGQLAISIQNIFQSISITRTRLKNGMAWYTVPLITILAPCAVFQNILCRSTSIMCILTKSN